MPASAKLLFKIVSAPKVINTDSKENTINKDIFYEEEKRDRVKAAREEVIKKKKEDAENYVNQTLMKDEHRYLRDVY